VRLVWCVYWLELAEPFLSSVLSSGIMPFSRRWSVESKDFELLVVGGETTVRFCESCKGMLRSILMDRDETAWLVRIFEELAVGEETRVFWNQAQPGFPQAWLLLGG
jgi:hypothetical protein